MLIGTPSATGSPDSVKRRATTSLGAVDPGGIPPSFQTARKPPSVVATAGE